MISLRPSPCVTGCNDTEILMNNSIASINHPTCFSNNKAILNSRPAHQAGVVLVVGLIMLLLLTLIGVTGSQVTNLEEKMAGNSRDYNLAFQAAESALRAGEAATNSLIAANYYTGSTQPYDWTNNKVTPYNGGTLAGGLYQKPKYIIESLPDPTGGVDDCPPPCEVGTGGGGGGGSTWLRITARGVGSTANAVVTLQSIYRR